MKLAIYIPTLARVNNQITWDSLPKKIREHTALVCRSTEAKEHTARGRRVLVCDEVGIGPTRDWILKFAHANKQKYMCMLNDDLIIQKRRPSMKITDAYGAEIEQSFEWIEDTLAMKVAHCGFAPRFLGWADPEKYQEPGRLMYVAGYNVPMVVDSGCYFTKHIKNPEKCVTEDINMCIQLLLAGLANRVSLVWRTRTSATNAAGGASLWRTAEQQEINCREMANAYPSVVTLRRKKAWKGMGAEEMWDVKVMWKKALQIGLESRSIG